MSAIRRVSNLGTQGVSTIVDGTITQADLNTNIPLSGMRNLIINGCMRVNQRNTAITSGVGYTVDRWYVNTGGTANTSTAQNADAPSGSGLSASLRVTGSGSVGSGMRWLGQRIEATNCDGLAYGSSSAKAITISFWVRATTPGTYTVSLLNSTRVYAASYSISSSNTWEYKTITIAGDTSLAISTMLDVRFIWYGSSETWITPNVWGTDTGFGAATNQVAAFGSGSIFAITGVQVEIATQATPFEQRPIATELALCQRYYEKSYSTTIAPGTNTLKGATYISASSDQFSNMAHTLNFSVEKRAVPDIVFYTSGGIVGSWTYTRSGTGDISTAMNWTSDWSGTTGGLVFGGVGAAWTPARIWGHWVAVSEL